MTPWLKTLESRTCVGIFVSLGRQSWTDLCEFDTSLVKEHRSIKIRNSKRNEASILFNSFTILDYMRLFSYKYTIWFEHVSPTLLLYISSFFAYISTIVIIHSFTSTSKYICDFMYLQNQKWEKTHGLDSLRLT